MDSEEIRLQQKMFEAAAAAEEARKAERQRALEFAASIPDAELSEVGVEMHRDLLVRVARLHELEVGEPAAVIEKITEKSRYPSKDDETTRTLEDEGWREADVLYRVVEHTVFDLDGVKVSISRHTAICNDTEEQSLFSLALADDVNKFGKYGSNGADFFGNIDTRDAEGHYSGDLGPENQRQNIRSLFRTGEVVLELERLCGLEAPTPAV